MIENDFFDIDYFEHGPQTSKSLYQCYTWRPELTIPLAHFLSKKLTLGSSDTVLDFGCAKGYLVHALRLLGYNTRGVDISKYAIANAMKEVEPYVKQIEPLSDDFDFASIIICKDVLEHIPYDSIDTQLEVLRSRCKTLFAIIPLGENGRYIIPAYELDKSHFIRENVLWWENRFLKAGFDIVESTTNLGKFKSQWQQVNPNGNLMITAYNRGEVK